MMDFRDKFNNSIRNIENIDKPDYPRSEVNYYADFVELLVLMSDTDGISYGDIQDRFFGEPDENNDAENNDRNETFIDDIYGIINERIVLYRNIYPFYNNNNVILLKKKLSQSQKIYLFLLLSSSLDIFRLFNSELTTDFETICYETMKFFLPNAKVKAFGKNSEYIGTAKEKIKKLAADIGVPVNDEEIQQINNNNTQERGLDIISWIPFNDICPNFVVFLCQCACGKEYEKKQHDTTRFEHYYEFYRTSPQHTLFVPYSLINPNNNKFYHSDYIEKGRLIFERLRISMLLKGKPNILSKLQTTDLIEECIKYRSIS